MGAVYAARHIHLGKPYAIKVLSAAIATNATAVERLKQEAIAASSIEHDNIVEVISFDRDADGSVFIVMEFLRGESLADRLERGPIPLPEALAIAHQIASALGAAHARNIVHRDLKPENVFLARKGDTERFKVLDFGISKIKGAEAEQVRMTRTGQLLGTPLYMSPEQARGEADVDRRVDIYALGVILYEMLTGSPPFEGRNYLELLWKHSNELPVPPKRRNPNVFIPDEVEAVVLRALAKRREERWNSMEEFASALVAAAPDVSIPRLSLPPGGRMSGEIRSSAATPVSPPIPTPATSSAEDAPKTEEISTLPVRRAPVWVWGALAGALVLGGGAIALWSGRGSSDPSPSSPTTQGPPTRETPISEPAGDPRTSEPAGGAPVRDDTLRDERSPEPGQPLERPALASVVEVALESTPPGAEVRFGDVVLGTTPCSADLPARGEPVRLVFHRDGYFDEVEEFVPAPGARISVRLRPRRRTSSESGSPLLPMKTEI
jgi:serine/threonine-protein kinase